MMPSIVEKLVELYAKGPVAQVHADADYQALCAQNVGDTAFNGERLRIENLRDSIDESIGPRTSYRDQVQFALRLLRRIPKDEGQAHCRSLILKTYGAKWSDPQREYFEKKSLLLVEAKDFFLSFTSRNPAAPGLNQINRNHEFFIKDRIGVAAYNKADLGKQNLLAEAIYQLLQDQQLAGFYYPLHEGNNKEVEEKLRGNCIRCLSFVQLVQGEIFRYLDAPKRNWCHFEFTEVEAIDTERILFVKIDDPIRGENINLSFDRWYRRFRARDPLMLERTRRYDTRLIDENFDKITKQLSEQITNTFDRICTQIPD